MAATVFSANTVIKSAEVNENFNLKADLASPTFTGTLTGEIITAPQIIGTTITGTSIVGTTITGTSLVGTTLTVSNISFPASQVASSNANTLDDYEEGTWTPTVSGSSVAGAGTYSIQVASYVKIGNTVFFYLYVQITAHTGTGNITITSLPFTANSATNNFASVSAGFPSNFTLSASHYVSGGYVSPNTTAIDLIQAPVGGGTAAAVAMDAAFILMMSGFYKV